MADSTQTDIDLAVTALTGLIGVAPQIIAIINTIKSNGQITLDEMNQLMATRQAAVAAADKALSGD